MFEQICSISNHHACIPVQAQASHCNTGLLWASICMCHKGVNRLYMTAAVYLHENLVWKHVFLCASGILTISTTKMVGLMPRLQPIIKCNIKKFLSAVTKIWVQTDRHTRLITRFTTGIRPVVNNYTTSISTKASKCLAGKCVTFLR